MTDHNSVGQVEQHQERLWLWLAPTIYLALVGVYFAGRYAGQWAEADSATFTNVIRVFVREGRLVPTEHGAVYPNGYAFQSISAFIIALTGLNVATLQQLVYPMLTCLIVIPVWVTYRELTGSARGATITTMLLLTQPEFLFVVLRSSHEKFTRTFLLLCLFLLARSFRLRHRPADFAGSIVLFYLSAFALIASNNLLAHSFIFAIGTAFVVGWLFNTYYLRSAHQRVIHQRLFYAPLICLGLVYFSIFYVYEPSQHDLFVFQTIGERLSALMLDVERESSNAYEPVVSGWINIQVYFLVSIANWIILASSFVIWACQGWQLLRHRIVPPQSELLLWLLYLAFAIQGGMSVVADASGVLTGNLQHRLFPSFSIIGVALVGTTIARWRFGQFTRAAQVLLGAGMFAFASLSILKATNDPLVSNKWTFYQPYELAALKWSDDHLRDSDIWTEFDERLEVAFLTVYGHSARHNSFGTDMEPTTRMLVMTNITRLRNQRLRNVLPAQPDLLRVFDNGSAQVYRLRAQTPYQR